MKDPDYSNLTPNVLSFYMETSAGGLPITLCACGLLIYQPMAELHMVGCNVYQSTGATELLAGPHDLHRLEDEG